MEARKLISAVGVLTPVTRALERYLLDVHDGEKSQFVEEAIQCTKNKAFRAAIVLSWVGAVYLLYRHVIGNVIKDFNLEARRRWPKWKDAVTIDDLTELKESEFLNVLEHIKVLTNGEHKELN